MSQVIKIDLHDRKFRSLLSEEKELAGVHYVCSKLALLGFIPVVLSRKMKHVDLIVFNQDNHKSLPLQVKTAFTDQDYVDIGHFKSEQDFKARVFPFHVFIRFVSNDITKVHCYVLTGQETKEFTEKSLQEYINGKHRKPKDQLKIYDRVGIKRKYLEENKDRWDKIITELDNPKTP
ncbi:MAG: hypothetical protein AB1442_01205 [Nitrospirota bacterium]